MFFIIYSFTIYYIENSFFYFDHLSSNFPFDLTVAYALFPYPDWVVFTDGSRTS